MIAEPSSSRQTFAAASRWPLSGLVRCTAAWKLVRDPRNASRESAHATSSGYGSPTPHAWLRSSRTCSSSASSSGIRAETKRPNPVFTPYVCSPWIDSSNSRARRIRSWASGLSVAFAPCTATSQTSSSERLSPVSSIVCDIGPSLERKSAFEHSTLVDSRNVDAGGACSRVDALGHETHELPVGYLDPAPTCFDAHPLDSVVQRRPVEVEDVHAHLHESRARKAQPDRLHAGKPTARLADYRRDLAGRLDGVRREDQVVGDERLAG